jgi:hypothetical protein
VADVFCEEVYLSDDCFIERSRIWIL